MTVDLQIIKEVVERGIPKGQCRIEGCESKSHKRQYCISHYSKLLRGTMDQDGNPIRRRMVDQYPPDFECIKCGKRGNIVKGFCKSHYNQFRKGFIGADGRQLREYKRIPKYKPETYCEVKGCGKKVDYNFMCRNHADMVLRGTMTEDGVRKFKFFENQGKKCLENDCDRDAVTKGRCRLHYLRMKRKPRVFINKGKNCSILACKSPAITKGLCVKHYARRKRKINLRKESLLIDAQQILQNQSEEKLSRESLDSTVT